MSKRTEGKLTLKELFQGRRNVKKAIWKLADSDRRLDVRLINDYAFKKVFHNKKALIGLLLLLLVKSIRNSFLAWV